MVSSSSSKPRGAMAMRCPDPRSRRTRSKSDRSAGFLEVQSFWFGCQELGATAGIVVLTKRARGGLM